MGMMLMTAQEGEKNNMFNNDSSKTKYSDIIELPHHVSSKHPPMPVRDRAAQFAPFAALTGHEEAMRKTAEQMRKEYDR